MKYNYQKIEKKWRAVWENKKAFAAKDFDKKPKFYGLVEFPYPSGDGLHVGHVRSYTAMDVVARKRRMEGYNVLYPMGWDAFGLPTENYAIKTGVSPAVATKKNTLNFKRQCEALGFSFDWDREINTSDPNYYKWTQWIFIELFKHGLAYKANVSINWCPNCKIGLANEEAVGGKCDRCGGPVEKRNKEQWMLKITAYADKLLEGLKDVDFLPEIKKQQENWIGRSEGALIRFGLITNNQQLTTIEVFTTRPDTIFGATFIAVSPELAKKWMDGGWQAKPEVRKHIEQELKKSYEREGKDKTGMDAGIKAINPANKEEIPVWIVNYVLGDVGTGAIMAVPAHDERDFEFAKKYKLPIRPVISKSDRPIKSYLMGLGDITENDLKALEIEIHGRTKDGNLKITIPESSLDAYENLIKEKMAPGFWNEYIGDEAVFIFKFKDGRVKRYVLDSQNEQEIDRLGHEFNEQPVVPCSVWGWLAANAWYTDVIIHTQYGRLINSSKFSGMDSEKAKWEITNFVGGKRTVQYKLRDWIFSRQRYWGEPIPLIFCGKCAWVPVPEEDLPVELPKVKDYKPRDDGESPLASVTKWVNVKCPKCKGQAKRETDVMPNWAGSSWYYLAYLFNKKGFAKSTSIENWKLQIENFRHFMPVDWYNGGMEHVTLHLLYSRFWNQFLYDIGVVSVKEPYKKRTAHGLILAEGGVKMSKSKGNVVNPDGLIKEFGADALRLYEMFIGPFDQAVAWDPHGIVGTSRFLERVWMIATKYEISTKVRKDESLERLLHKTIKKVSEDIEAMSFNTSVSAMMILVNEFQALEKVGEEAWKKFLTILAPFAPHIAEELWSALGEKKSISEEPWPKWDEKLIEEETFELVIQINGKVRDKISVSRNIPQEQAEKLAFASDKIKASLAGAKPKKVIFVAGRLINFVV